MKTMIARALWISFLVMAVAMGAQGAMPYSGNQVPADRGDYASYLFINGTSDLPVTYSPDDTWWLTDYRGIDNLVSYNPQEFYGVRGMGANRAWEVTTGRPDVTIAIIDSGIRWNQTIDCNLLRKYYINRGELPMPAGGPNASDHRFGGYDVTGDGVFNIEDYLGDPRVTDANGNGWIDPEDLILLLSDGVDGDGNGYVDDISGWDFFEGDNNARDDVDFGHGASQAGNAGSEAALVGEQCPAGATYYFGRSPGTCPNCMIMPLRYSDSFVGDVNHFGEAVVYAVDNGVRVVEVAAGTFNATSFGQEAANYAFSHGVVIDASEADEAAAHHNWPAAYEHTLVHNSIRPPEGFLIPESYLYLNGCTNFGSYTFVSIPSTSCSSQATGLASGVSGLLVSAALNAVERGKMTRYIQDDGAPSLFPLSAAEMEQLWRLSADDIDFSSAYPDHAFSPLWPQYKPANWPGDGPDGSVNNFGLDAAILPTRRYQTVRGWDYFTGYGRINAARLVRFIGLEDRGREFVPGQGPYGVGEDLDLAAQDRIPPEAEILQPRRWRQYGHDAAYNLLLPDDPAHLDQVVVTGHASANRVTAAGGTFDYVVEWAPGAQGAPAPEGLAQAAPGSEEKSAGPWTEAARVTGLTHACVGELARIPVALASAAVAANPDPFALEGDPTSPSRPERFALRVRLRVISHPLNLADTVNNEAVQQKQVDVYLAKEALLRDGLGAEGRTCGGAGSPSFHDLDGDGRDELLLPTDDGLVHAFTDVGSGAELPGWPVSTLPLDTLPRMGQNAYTRGDVPNTVRGSIQFAAASVADLDDDGIVEILAADLEGLLYAWEPDGRIREGFPVSVDRTLSASNLRNPVNQRDWAIFSAPSVGDLDPVYPGLEILASCADGHIYAWHADGTPVEGWPVILRDPAKVATMDAGTRKFTCNANSGWNPGSKALATPSLGDIDGDGTLDVVATVNEEYKETPNAVFDPALQQLLALAGRSGNGRIYALHATGAATAGTPATEATSHTQDQAYLPGWPVRVAAAVLDLLPIAGQGGITQPPLLDAGADGMLEVATSTHFGPGYLLKGDGSSHLGLDGSVYQTLRESTFGADSAADDSPSLPTFSAFAAGALNPGAPPSVAAGCAGLTRLIDIALPGRQTGAEDHLGVWNTTDGGYRPFAPAVVNDVQFFSVPLVVDIDGDGVCEVIQGTSIGDLNWIGTDAAMDRHTGGWQMGSASLGRAPANSGPPEFLGLANFTREGYLRLFPTTTPAVGDVGRNALSQWPQAGHDARNTGNLSVDAERPYPVTGLSGQAKGKFLLLGFIATGDDRDYGAASRYEVRTMEGPVTAPRWPDGVPLFIGIVSPKPSGEPDSIYITSLEEGSYTLMVRAYDAAGNGSALAHVAMEFHFHPIPGDCNGDFEVTIGEVQGAVNMFLGILPPDCGVDCNGDGTVSIGEVQKVINAFLGLPSSC
jgi:hypothetical protein